MPNHIGAFLKASKCFSALGINITRVSYNKAIDSHTLFIDAEGSKEQLEKADVELEKIGYLQNNASKSSIVLIEFQLEDVPGSVTNVLTLINEFNFNISYISSQENGTDYQHFKMGLYVDDSDKIARFLREVEKICKVRVIDYNSSEKVYDNSIFYNTYVGGLSKMMELDEEVTKELLVHTNLAMQTLDEQGLSPFKTFDSITKFAELIAASKGENFNPRITSHKITDSTEIITVEPPCGSNTTIIKSCGKVLFVDSGYACYEAEMVEIFKKLLPDFDSMEKTVLVTHADVDHCGLLPIFDKVVGSAKSILSLGNEYCNKDGFREENPLHKPYICICKILTDYKATDESKLVALWGDDKETSAPLTDIGIFDFGELHFQVYEGKGGHLRGEVVLIDYEHRIAITGDVYINMHGFTKEQAEYNQYAPILMTSVDTNPALCAEERKALVKLLGDGEWQIFGAHGFRKDYSAK